MTIGAHSPSPVQPVYTAPQAGVKAASNHAPKTTSQPPTQEADSVHLSPAALAHLDADHDGDRK